MNHIAQYRTSVPHQLHHNHCPPIQNFTARFAPPNLPLPDNVNVNSVMIPQLVNESAMQYSVPLQPFLQPLPQPENRPIENNIKINDIQRKQLINDRHFQPIPTSNDRQEHSSRPENCDVNYKPPTSSPPVLDRRFVHCNQGAKNCLHCYNALKGQSTTTVLKVMVDAATMTDQEEMEQVANWPSLSVQPTTKVAEYLTSLRQFLKLSTPPEGKKRLGDVRIVTSADGSRLYCCPECHVAYPDKNLLEPHLAAHKIERRFICNVCGAGLKRKEHLDRHQLSHSEERPYSCSICPKTFKRNEHLSRHSIIHSGHKAQMERRYVCGTCGLGHLRKEHLDRHLLSHTDERPFCCSVCPKTFKRHEHLARHVIIHSGQKNQVCSECGKAFYRKDHLRKHAQGHVTKRTFKID